MIICPPIREYDFRMPETKRPLSTIQCRHQKCEAIGEITCSDDAMNEKRKPKSKYRIRDRITLAKVKTVIQNDNTPVDDAGCEKSIPTKLTDFEKRSPNPGEKGRFRRQKRDGTGRNRVRMPEMVGSNRFPIEKNFFRVRKTPSEE